VVEATAASLAATGSVGSHAVADRKGDYFQKHLDYFPELDANPQLVLGWELGLEQYDYEYGTTILSLCYQRSSTDAFSFVGSSSSASAKLGHNGGL
jgi:hypothetical protein